VNEILIELSHLQKVGKSLVFCWVPGHTGLSISKATDAAAKVVALHGNLTSDRALGSGFHTFLHCAVLSSWQDEWTNTCCNTCDW
jgi:hypothetical protein